MNSDYWLGREEATWNDAQVIVDTSIFNKKKPNENILICNNQSFYILGEL